MWIFSRRRTAVCALGLFLLTALTRLPLLRLERPIDDEVVYAVAAQAIVGGGQPYVSAVERKPPFLFYVYAAVLWTFGPFNWRALHAVELAWILLTMAGLYRIGRELFDADTGLVAALLYSVFQAWSYWNNLAFNGEVLMNLPIVWAYAIGFAPRKSRVGFDLFGAGLLLAAGFLLKQPGAIAAVPLGVYVLLPAYRANRYTLADSFLHATCLTAGFFGLLAMVASWLQARGLLEEAIYWTITNHDVPHIYWDKALEHTVAFIAFCLPITAGAWVSCRDDDIWAARKPERTVLIGLALVSAIGASASGRFFPHYYIALVPPCALLAAPLFARAWRPLHRDRRKTLLPQLWLGATVVVFAVAQAGGLARQPVETEAGRYIREHSSANDRIFVWGQAAQIYLDARRRPASRYIGTFPLTGLIFGARLSAPGTCIDTSDRIVHGSWQKLQQDFAGHLPAYIVDTEVGHDAKYPVTQFPALEELLAAEYSPVVRTPEALIYGQRHQTSVAQPFVATADDADGDVEGQVRYESPCQYN